MQNAHIGEQLRLLHDAVLTIVAVINRPERDERLIHEAGLQLDRALFPLLVLVERYGPISIVELAARVGRDHSVVSRQIGKLGELELVSRAADAGDRRLRLAVPTERGREMARRIDAARERFGRRALAGWQPQDLEQLVTLMRRFADAIEKN